MIQEKCLISDDIQLIRGNREFIRNNFDIHENWYQRIVEIAGTMIIQIVINRTYCDNHQHRSTFRHFTVFRNFFYASMKRFISRFEWASYVCAVIAFRAWLFQRGAISSGEINFLAFFNASLQKAYILSEAALLQMLFVFVRSALALPLCLFNIIFMPRRMPRDQTLR